MFVVQVFISQYCLDKEYICNLHISLFYEKFLLLIPSQYNQGSRIWESQDVKYGYNKTTSLTLTVILPVLCFVCSISAYHG